MHISQRNRDYYRVKLLANGWLDFEATSWTSKTKWILWYVYNHFHLLIFYYPFLDLTISVGADIEKVRCHKFIVAMVSDVIQSESVMKDEIIFTNIKKDILQEIIDYCYTQMIGPFVNKSHVSQNFLILVWLFDPFWPVILGRKHLWWDQETSNPSSRTSYIGDWGGIGQWCGLLWRSNHRMGTYLSWYCCCRDAGTSDASTSNV